MSLVDELEQKRQIDAEFKGIRLTNYTGASNRQIFWLNGERQKVGGSSRLALWLLRLWLRPEFWIPAAE